MTEILEGRSLARKIRLEVAERVERFVAAGGRPPCLAAVLVGDDPASRVYVRSKGRALDRAGCASRTFALPADAAQEEVRSLVERLNEDGQIDGILVQLPLPSRLDSEAILEAVSPAKDVDGFHSFNVGRLWRDRPRFVPATPSAVVELLRRRDIQLAGRNAVIVGRSNVVGKPLAALLLRQQCTVTICHSRTGDLEAECRRADLLVAAVGQPALIGPQHVKRGAVVIDVGINRISDPELLDRLLPHDEERRGQLLSKGSVLVGDVDFARVAPRCAAITPVPRGIGPLTVAMLLVNTLAAARGLQGIEAPS